jgi:hypothetical protein
MPALSPIHREALVTFNEAAAWVRDRTGRKTHLATLHRWALRGCRGRRLESVLIGRQRMTSREALLRFFDARSQPADIEATAPAAPPPPPPAMKSAALDVEQLHERLFGRRKAKAS